METIDYVGIIGISMLILGFIAYVVVSIMYLCNVPKWRDSDRRFKEEKRYRRRLSCLIKEAKRTGEVVIAECFYYTYGISDSNRYVKSYFEVNGKKYQFNEKQWRTTGKALRAQGISVEEYFNLQLMGIRNGKSPNIVETQRHLCSE
jgi:predicted membrane channel-forming protein YqfA (hemolysin III family)